MKIYDMPQGSTEWFRARSGVPTASEFDNLISPNGEIRKGQTPTGYLHRKLAECLTGGAMPTASSWAMDNGSMLEGEVLPLLRFEYEWKVRRVGFVTTDDGKIGASPDGLVGDSSGVEIKCPELPAHVRYVLAGVCPPEYYAQVQGCMHVCGFRSWHFVSYSRQFPPLIVTVERDEEFQAQLAVALAEFLKRFETALAKLRLLKPLIT